MSDEQENAPEANGPKPIRIGKRSLFTPSEAVAVEQHSRSHIATLRRHHSQRPYAQIVRLYHRRRDHSQH